MSVSRPIRLAINGYGRIGRCFLRALWASPLKSRFQVVLINEPADLASMVYLTQFDSTHGRFAANVDARENHMCIDGQSIAVTHAQTPEAVDWAAYQVDILIECSGIYSQRSDLMRFIRAGCPRILLSHPGYSVEDLDATIVVGVNHHSLDPQAKLVSAASCTTNAAVPVLDVLQREVGLEQVLLTTLHSVMNDQPLIDGYHHHDLRRTRSAMQSIIPTSTGLARGVERLLPELTGKVQAKAIRVPTLNVSAIDLCFSTTNPVSVGDLNSLLSNVARTSLHGLLAYSEAAHASIDFNHDPHSAIIDGSQTRTSGPHLANLFVWFDNEWGFANRMLDVLMHWQQHLH